MRKRRSLIRTVSLPAISVTVNRKTGSTGSELKSFREFGVDFGLNPNPRVA